MNLFVLENEYTYYLRLYILGHEPICCVEDEYTHLRLYWVMNLFVVWKMNAHIVYIYKS